ncbi:MAG: outer membrane beta-barrel protein [Ignavibacteria bacterium]
MKKITVLLIVLMLGLSFGNSYAQKFKLNVIGGYSLPLPDLKGDYPGDATKDPLPYMMKNGFNVGGIGKYFLDKKNSQGLTLTLVYTGYSNSVDNAMLGVSNQKFQINMFTVGLGYEYRPPVKGAVMPFFGADIIGNFLSGKYKVTPTGLAEQEYTMKSASRFGFNVGAGTEFIASSKITFVVGVKYQYYNLLGKDYVEDGSGTEYNLNDKEYTDALNVTHKARNMMGVQIYGGINFNLDQIFK